jgi:glucose/arabinose dehydrogenase/PKD repeat protein
VLVLVVALLGIALPRVDAAAAATPTFVQVRAKEIKSGTTNSLAFNSANTAGNLIVVYAIWSNTGSATVSDSRGNSYATAAARTTWSGTSSVQVFYARNVAAGANTVTVTHATAVNSYSVIYIHEYSGIDKVDPVDVTRSANGTGSTMNSGSLTTTNAADLLFAAGASSASITAGSAGYTTRSTAFGNRTQDQRVTAPGSYNATATQSGAAWAMQLVAFKADPGTGTGDATPPTVSVTAPTAGATVSATTTVTATAADNVGVAGVQFLLDGANLGAEDTTAPYSIAWDTTATTNGSHSLSARARDGAGNSATSAAVSVTVANSTGGGSGGLAAAYAFDEGAGTTAADASGHGLTGTLSGGATWSVGKYGTAVNLDGSDDFVNLANPTGLQLTGSMTVSAWVNSAAFPAADAAIVSKRAGTEVGYQLDTTTDRGPRTVGFKLTSSSGSNMMRYGATTLQLNTWYHVAGVYDATARTMNVYLNGQLDNGSLVGTVTATQQNSANNVNIGRRGTSGYAFNGRIDDTRIYNRALSAAEIQTDMATQLTPGGSSDSTPPTVSISAPANNAQVSGIVNVTAAASDNVGVTGVQFYVDDISTGPEDTTAPYGLAWDTRTLPNGSHRITARARDAAANATISTAVTVNVANTAQFQNEVLATGFDLPTAIEFLPDGRMLVVELEGKIKVLPPPYTTPDTTPFLQLTNVGSAGVQQGIYDIVLDPNFSTNRFYYIFYTLGSPNHDRLSRFTANSTLTGTVAGSELVLYEDPQDANAEHHGGALNFGNDGKLYFTTGEHFDAAVAQSLSSPRGKIHRINKDGTIPNDNPFFDGTGPNVDSIWALGLRNPYRASYDAPTGRLFIGDVGGNNNATAKEEVNLGAAGANYGWPNSEGPCSAPCTSPIYSYPHNGRDAAVTGGFVYRGSQFPSEYVGSYFFADYTQNWIRRLTFDANGNVSGVFNFEPIDGSVDGPYGDIVYLTEGPDGSLYYVDLGYSDISGTFGVSKIRRIRFSGANQAPVASSSATPTAGPAPLAVDFSSAGSSDPEGQPLTYSWTFGDGGTSTAGNPTHTYLQAGQYTARLSVSDGVNTTLSIPLTISVGNKPAATILSPQDGRTFQAGDVISFSGNATDTEDGTLPASAFTWNIDFLHETHVHPGVPVTGVKSGSFTIPTSGHDFSGNTRYRIALTVTDSDGLTTTQMVTIYPQKVNLTFNTVPSGLTLFLDGIAKVGGFVYDTLVGFTHTIEARDQGSGSTAYTFQSWSDGGASQHQIVAPSAPQTYTATFAEAPAPATPAFVQVNSATPQSPQSTVATSFVQAQTAGNLNAVAIGWNESVGNITQVRDSAGNIYQAATTVARGSNLSQAMYYAKNIVASAAGANTVTVTFDKAVTYADIRILEYSGLDKVSPVDVTSSAAGSVSPASSGPATTNFARELLLGAGMTSGVFTGAGTGYTARIITKPDADIAEDRNVASTGSYSATAPQSGTWVMQMVAFRAAGQ